MESFYTVILKTPGARVEPKVLGQQLAKAMGIPFIDAMPVVKRHSGYILADQLECGQAAALVAGLESAGFEAISVPSGEMAALTGGGVAQQIQYYEDSLAATVGSPGKEMDFPWQDIRILMACQLQVETTAPKVETVKTTGIGLKVGAHGVGFGVVQRNEPLMSHEKKMDQKAMARVVTSDGRCLDLPGKGLLYTHLGDRIKPTGIENYRAVLADIWSFCPSAFTTEAFRSFLDGGAIPTYPSYRALDEEAVWLLQLDRMGLLPVQERGEGR